MTDKTPMSAAPMRYDAAGRPDWGNMWETFCALAQDGGPPHRADLLTGDTQANEYDPQYMVASYEIARGIKAVSGLVTRQQHPGWIEVICHSREMAAWIAGAMRQENVDADSFVGTLYVPVAASYRVEHEVKSVITAVAKTTHSWYAHARPATVMTTADRARKARVVNAFRREPVSESSQ